MADRDLLQLYSGRLLALAADIPRLGRLPAPDGTGRRRSAVCGSTVTVDVVLRDGRVADFAQEVRACALGQAAAAALGGAVVGRSEAELRAARDALWAMLREEGAPPGAPFEALEALVPARDHPNRHHSIMLAIEATLDALADAAPPCEDPDKKAAARP